MKDIGAYKDNIKLPPCLHCKVCGCKGLAVGIKKKKGVITYIKELVDVEPDMNCKLPDSFLNANDNPLYYTINCA